MAIKLTKYLHHTAVINRYSGSVDAAGNLLRGSAGEWDPVGTPSIRKLPTKRMESQEAAEASTNKRVLAFMAYCPAGTDVVFGDRLTNISTRATGGTTTGGTVWGTPATVLLAGPAYVRGIEMATLRGQQFKVLRCEIVE